jgi:hypothetical protein
VGRKRAGKKNGNGGAAGTRAKNAAKRRWEKRKDMLFGAGLSVGVYVLGHAIDALQGPVLKHLGVVLEAALHNFDILRVASQNSLSLTYALYDRASQYEARLVNLNAVRAQIESNAHTLDEKWENLAPAVRADMVKAWDEELAAADSDVTSPLFEKLLTLLDEHSRRQAQRGAPGR